MVRRGPIPWFVTVLAVVAQNHTYDVGVRSHDDPHKACWYVPPPVVVDDAGYIVDPAVVVESYGRRHLSSSWRASRQQLSSIAKTHLNKWYSCSHVVSLRPCTLLTSGSVLLGQSRSAGHSADSGMGGRGTGRNLRLARYGRCWKGDASGRW